MSYVGEFGYLQMLIAGGLVITTIALSKLCALELENTFAVAALRCFVQLSLIGFALRWLFAKESLELNLFALTVMTLVAGQTVLSRTQTRSWRLFGFALLALIGGVWIVSIPSIASVFGQKAIFEAKLFVPLMGLLLGNALSAISLTFIQLQRIQRENMREIEALRALGATSWESGARLYRSGLRQALTPILNAMSVVGVVSLPGAMAGQVLGGVDPLLAGRVQIVIMFLILLTSLLGSLVAVGLYHGFEMPTWLRGRRDIRVFADSAHRRISISGASGAGKSRLVKSMTGLDDRRIFEFVFNKSRLKSLAEGSTLYISQQASFIPGTVRDNLLLPYKFRANRSLTFTEMRIRSLLNQLDLPESILDSSATTLSGGEGQMIQLIRALQLDPKILILDEPTSALDASRRAKVERLLQDWIFESDDHRYILISHDPEQVARLSDLRYSLSDGRLRVV